MKKIIITILLFLTACAAPARQALPTATVSAGGSIQACLDTVQAGGECLVKAGTYNESLTLKTIGTATNRISLRCETPLACTVNSGASRSLITTGQKGYYTIDGFRFLSTYPSTSDPMTASINLSLNYWGDGDKFEKGNDGFVFRNNYVEGALYIYGSDNLVEGNEFNGRGVVWDAITERSQPSENNIFRNNTIHDYYQRAGWSLQMTRNTLWEENTIYNIGVNHAGNGSGIDCDGAGSAVYSCNIRNNLIYNSQSEAAIILENTFDSIIEGNTIRDSRAGMRVINYNITNVDGFKSDQDYQLLTTNTVIRNNTFTNLSSKGISCAAVKGNTFENNAMSQIGSYALNWEKYGNYCGEWIVRGNNISAPNTVFWHGAFSMQFIGNVYGDLFKAYFYETGKTLNFAQWQALGGYDISTLTPTMTPTATSTPTASATATWTENPPSPTATASPSPTFTPTVTPVLPTLTRTPTITPTMTATKTPTPTVTSTPIPPTFTPTPAPLCIKSVWTKQLKARPAPSMYNTTSGVSIDPNAVIYIEEIVRNNEGTWGMINYRTFAAMHLVSNNRTYAVAIECP